MESMWYNIDTTTGEHPDKRKEAKIMKRIYFDGMTEGGSYIQSASVLVPEDYTMLQLVQAIKACGYIKFKTKTMRVLANVI